MLPLLFVSFLLSAAQQASPNPTVAARLQRLEDKGLLSSWYGDPTPVRGGRAKRFFRPKTAALRAVRASLDRIQRMTAGLELVLRPE